jgi:hypothetical protein
MPAAIGWCCELKSAARSTVIRPRDLPPNRPVIQIAGLFAARVRTANKRPRLAPPELAGTIQRGNQNKTRERSRPQGQRSLTLLPK